MSEVVTKRLLTDETGQLLVTALNSIAASCKPDATEINMGPNDNTKVATQINSLSEQIGTVNNKYISRTNNANAGSMPAETAGSFAASAIGVNPPSVSGYTYLFTIASCNQNGVAIVYDSNTNYIIKKAQLRHFFIPHKFTQTKQH